MEEASATDPADEEIVRRVLAGEGTLFELIMRRHNQRLFRVARSILGNDTEAEEVVQQAYVSAYLHLAQFKGEARFATWLTRIAVHEASANARRLRRFSSIENPEEGERPMMSTEPDPERLAANAEMSRLLERLIDSLPQANRTVFVLREVEGLSTSETAECIGITPDAVKVRLHRGKAALRREILGQAGQAARGAFPFLGARCDRMVEAVFARLGLPLPATRS